MMLQQALYRTTAAPPIPIHLGAFLKMLRDRQAIAQAEVLKHLPGWQQSSYSKVEKDVRAPTFDQLVPIYRALAQAGVQVTLQDRQQFLLLARRKIESMKTRHERKADADWDKLRVAMAEIDRLPVETPGQGHARVPRGVKLHFAEGRHLIGREEWLASIVTSLQGFPPKKLLILQGPVGIGKSSELHRLANYFLQSVPSSHVMLCELPPIEQEGIGPDIALELLLGDILDVVGSPLASMPTTNLQARVKYVLDCLARADRTVLLLLDHAEHLLNEQGDLALLWKQFLTKFVQARHDASLVLTTKEWPGSFMEETQLVMHTMIPPLTRAEGCQLLQRLGLGDASDEQLGAVVEAVGGIPQCLEWVARLAQEPLLRNDWAAFEEEGETSAQYLAHLLEDASMFGGPVAKKLQALLERVIKRLSPDAQTALRELAVSPLPLGSPALKALYHDPTPLNELRDNSLLVAYPRRVQLLPMVAAQIGQRLDNDQICAAEERLIGALNQWLSSGIASMRDRCEVFTELARLFIRRHRLLAAAELILYHGWLIGQLGPMQRLAQLVQQVLDERPWADSPESEAETESGGILLHYYLGSYLGIDIDARERAEAYARIRAYVAAGQVTVENLMEVHLVDQIMLSLLAEDRLEEAQSLLEACSRRLAPLLVADPELHAMLLSKRAVFYNRWSSYAQSQGRAEEAKQLREEVIALYDQCLSYLEEAERGVEVGTLRESTLKKKRASFLNNLAYQLHSVGRFDQALEAVTCCLELKEQGYAERDSLPAAVGEKSQILASLGQFQESLRLDEQAREEIVRLAAAGDTMSQDEQWIYQVNQARLYLLLARVDDAERLLREAEPRVRQRRKVYKMLAKTLLHEIDQWRSASGASLYQLDWRWVERYRILSAYDAYWWWAHAGPFSEEEQREWDELFPPVDEDTKDRLREVLVQSRDRELAAALAQGREPRLHYPAIEISAVRKRIADFLALDGEIARDEPNAIVRRLYHGAIEDEVCFLRMIEATYEGAGEGFWAYTQQLYPLPTSEEVQYALARVRQVILQGMLREDTAALSRRLIEVLGEQLRLPLDLPATEAVQSVQEGRSEAPAQAARMISAQAAQLFFETVLRECGYEGWQVVRDPSASGPRVEPGLRQLFVQDSPIPIVEIREYVSHELLGHVARSVAGERSPLGLLGMGTKDYMPTEEGLADYHERHVAAMHGEAFDDSGTWLGTLAVGLAGGVVTSPQTFSSLFSFFEPFLLLYRLLWRDDEDRPTAEQRARKNALTRCLRTFRGVPDLERPGVCFTKDVVYLRGLMRVEQAVAEDETMLDRLAMGKIALELLPDLQELGMVAPPQLPALRQLAYDPGLDDYIASFDNGGGPALHDQ